MPTRARRDRAAGGPPVLPSPTRSRLDLLSPDVRSGRETLGLALAWTEPAGPSKSANFPGFRPAVGLGGIGLEKAL